MHASKIHIDRDMNYAAQPEVRAVLGPTNTGKTHFAVERMLSHRTGMIGLPLRLLAREVYQRIVAKVGVENVALITGEERILPHAARYWVATVEAMPLQMPVEFMAIDEIQTANDLTRGHVFTDRILNARGSQETLLLGAATMAPVLRNLLPGIEIIERPRLSNLFYAGSKKITRQPLRSAIIAFSQNDVYAIAELVRRERGGAAVVMGALSPRTRNAQVELYQNGDVDFLVATDAIGMGLNLDVRHVAFSNDVKFDGRQHRPLTPAELAQIAGRAGRHTTDGTFGVTGLASPFDNEVIDRLQQHEFQSIRVIQWRNSNLDYANPDALLSSLNQTPTIEKLTRIPNVIDQITLEQMMRNGSASRATDPKTVELLWQCCQIPDYRNISLAQHSDIVTSIFTDLSSKRKISTDWIAEQVRFCDNASGDIDTLSNRIKQIRTWTFVANRKNWLDDPTHWRDTTSQIENRLSDALHERLVQRFVDRRTSVLLRHLRDKHMVNPEINEQGEISLEGHLIGSIDGFRFKLAKSDGDADAKALRTAANAVVAPELKNRALRLAAAPNDQIILATDGRLRWKGDVIAQLSAGDDIFAPRIVLLADDALTGGERDAVQERLELWLRHHINTGLELVRNLIEPEDLEGSARGVAFRLAENLGVMPRADIADEIKALDQDVRGKMRKLGIKFGAYHIYQPQSLKPAPRELALILYALKNGDIEQAGVSELPGIILSGRTSFEINPEIDTRLYEIAGFKVAGNRAVRVDILERLADIIRPLISYDAKRPVTDTPAPEGAADGNGFRVTVEMTSLLGCAGDDFASILKSIGYRLDRRPLPTAQAAEPAVVAEGETTAPTDDAAAAKADDVPIAPEASADTAESETKADVKPDDENEGPAEPQFDDVWLPARRRPANPRPKHNSRQSNASQGKSDGKPHGKPRNAKGRPQNESGRKFANKANPKPSKPREKPMDPDSPFAALAALKQKL